MCIIEYKKETEESTTDLVGKKITKVSQNSEENNSETVTNKHDKEIPKEIYISPEERKKIISSLRLLDY